MMLGLPTIAAEGGLSVRKNEILGWRRTALVRIVDDGGPLRAEAVGQGHRLPRVVSIPMGTASRLIAGGVPSVCTHRTGG